MNKTLKIVLLSVAALVLLAGGIAVGIAAGNRAETTAAPPGKEDSAAQDWTGEQPTYTGEKNTDTIDIPGYGSIDLKADATAQTVNLYNPEQNTCYFKMSLLLADGAKLWQSDLVAPGKALYNITLDQPLAAGSYEDAVLKYECFTMDDAQTPLNGSEIKLTLNALA